LSGPANIFICKGFQIEKVLVLREEAMAPAAAGKHSPQDNSFYTEGGRESATASCTDGNPLCGGEKAIPEKMGQS